MIICHTLIVRQVATFVRTASLLAAPWLLASSANAQAVTTNWTNDSGGSFTDSANWTLGVPGADDTAVFRRGNVPAYNVSFGNLFAPIHPTINRLIIGNNTVNFQTIQPSTLTVDEFGIMRFGGDTIIGETASDVAVLNMNLASLSTLYATLGSALGSSGTLNVGGSTRTFNVNGTGALRELIVGFNGTGAVNITSGADVTVADDTVLGRFVTGVGNVSVNGPGSTWTNTGDLVVGENGFGTFNVENNGAVNVMGQLDIGIFNNVGVMTVDAGTTTVTSFVHVGGSNVAGANGGGTLNIRNGATVTSLNFCDIGRSVDSTGLVRVDSASTWNTGPLSVGELGDGTLEVMGAATVNSNSASEIGRVAGSTGAASVDGNNSRWIITGNFDVGREGIGTLEITGGGRVVMDTAGTNSYIGRFAGGEGDVIVSSGGRWGNMHNLYIGEGGTGTLNVTAGGYVENRIGVLGNLSASKGTATISGSVAQWVNTGDKLIVGNAGEGTLNITNGGRVFNNAGSIGDQLNSIGTATVNGMDSWWSNSGELTVASFSTDAALFIKAGGRVTNTNGYIGSEAGSIGDVTVTGSDGGNRSTWNNSGELTVAKSSQDAELRIEAGGLVLSANGWIGYEANSSGVVTVTGSDENGNRSNWTNAFNLTVGNRGTGTLLIDNGGSVANIFGRIASEAGSTGSEVTVTGTESTWHNELHLTVGGAGTGFLDILEGGAVSDNAAFIANGTVIVAGTDGEGNPSKWTNSELAVGASDDLTGNLIIEAGGSVSDAFGNIGSDAGSIGTARVMGIGSSWTHVMFLRVGDSGTGTLVIEEGGSVSSDGDGYVANMMGSTGTATVSGDGSTWTNGNELRVGNSGTGTLMIEAGGSVSNVNGTIGYNAGSIGTVTVTGAEANWTNSGNLRVGNAGMGTLDILAGGAVANNHGLIGALANSVGTATVSGAGSIWSTSGRLSIGGDAATGTNGGTGTLRIQAGAAVGVAEDIVLFPNGLVDFEGGTLSTMAVSFQGGGQFDWTGGTLHVDVFDGNLVNKGGTLAPGESAGSTAIIGNYTQQAAGKLQAEIGGTLINTQYDFVNVTGNAILGGALELALINGFVPSPTNTFTIFNADNLLNFFSNVTNAQRLTTIDGTGSFLVHYGPTSIFNPDQIVLTSFERVLLPGDYNNNGIVDAADYVVWRNGLGTIYTQNDYNVWRAHFGQTAGSGATLPSAEPLSAAVPEPTTLVLLILLAAGMHFRRHRVATCVSKLVHA